MKFGFFFSLLLFRHSHLTEVSFSHGDERKKKNKTDPACRCSCTQLNVSPLQIYIFSFSRARCSFSLNVLNHCKLSALMVISLNGVLGRVTFFFNLFNTKVLHSRMGCRHQKHIRLRAELSLKWVKSGLKIIYLPLPLLHLCLIIANLVLLYAGEHCLLDKWPMVTEVEFSSAPDNSSVADHIINHICFTAVLNVWK